MAEEESLTSAPSSSLVPQVEYARSRPRNTSTRQGRRTRLSTEERAKVLEVRRQRACLRCKMLKIQCSKENPCKPCLSSAVRGYERKVLSFCYCVRTRFADVDIFHSNESGPTPEVPPSIRTLMDQIEPPTLPVLEENVFEDTLIRWLTSAEYTPPEGSIVAMLYDMVGNSDSLRRAVDDQLPSDFQTFLFTTSLAHTGWSGPVAHRDLCIAGHLCGSRIVRRLDRILTPQFLSRCDKDAHRALFLLIFGVILGVSYSTRLTTSPSFPHDLLGPEMRHSPTLWLAMKEHLAQMLAHHLIFLGSMLGIKLDTASEKTIIDTAVNRWNKPERSLWAGLAGDTLPARLPPSDLIPNLGLEDFNVIDDIAQQQRSLSLADPSTGSPPPHSSLVPMVALSHPDLADLQAIPQMSDDNGNPESFLSMTNEDISGLVAPITDLDEFPGASRSIGSEGGPPHTKKNRSVWIVRPFDDGGNREPVSVYARFRLQQGQNLGLFV